MGDTGFESTLEGKLINVRDDELYARLYAQSPELARLIKLWPLLSHQVQLAIVEQAEGSVSCHG